MCVCIYIYTKKKKKNNNNNHGRNHKQADTAGDLVSSTGQDTSAKDSAQSK